MSTKNIKRIQIKEIFWANTINNTDLWKRADPKINNIAEVELDSIHPTERNKKISN